MPIAIPPASTAIGLAWALCAVRLTASRAALRVVSIALPAASFAL